MKAARPHGQNARLALAAYLRLLAACLEDEADLIESDGTRSEDVLRRFRDGVLALSLQDAPLDTLMVQSAPADIALTGASAADPEAPKKRG